MTNSAAQMAYGDGSALRLEGLCLEGRFEVERRIGWGSYAELFLARNLDPRDGEPEVLVVKALNTTLQGEVDRALERTLIHNFRLEIAILSRLRHPNIIRTFASGSAADLAGREFHYLVMEYMAGGDAANRYRGKQMSLEVAVRFLGAVCEALTHAHAKNVIHRDVKPKNLLLSEAGSVVKVTDFGTARLLDLDNSDVTRVGTAVYSAPEHYSLAGTPGLKVTPAADVYSLAKTFYFLVTGHPPTHVKQQEINALPPALSAQPWAPALLQVLRKATLNRPEGRYQSIHAFYSELSDILELTQLQGRTEGAKRSAHVSQRRPSRIEVKIAPPPRVRMAHVVPGGPVSVGSLEDVGAFVAAQVRAARAWLFRHAARGVGVIEGLLERLGRGVKSVPAKFVGYCLAVTAALIVLMATYVVLNRGALLSSGVGTGVAGDRVETTMTTTDLNVRSGPSSRASKVGLAERGSRLRVLSTDETGNWYEVEILQHGRPKDDPNSADRGWVYKKYLTPEPAR